MFSFKNKLWIYTFAAIFIKCIVFLGFTLSETHKSIWFADAFNIINGQFLPFYCAFVVVFLSFAFLLRNRLRLWYLIIVNLLVSLLLFIDVVYFRGFNEMPSLLSLQQTSNLDGLLSCIVSLIDKKDVIFIIDILVLSIVAIVKKDLYKDVSRNQFKFIAAFAISLFVIIYVPINVGIFDRDNSMKYYFNMLNPNTTSKGLSPIGYHVVDAFSFVKDSQGLELSLVQREEISRWFEEKKENLPDNKYKGLFKDKNLIYIQVESLEQFIIGQKVDGQEITPNLNRLAKNSLYFSNVHEQVGQGTTSDAELMATTSVYPLAYGSTFFRFPYTTYNSLPKLLEARGYSTLAIHGDEGSFWNWVNAFTAIGFQKCIDSSMLDKSEIINMGISDGSVFKQAQTFIKAQKKPFYTYIITLTSHGPFGLPKEYRELNLEPNLDQSTLGGYFQSLHYVDKQIGLFLEDLKKEGLMDDTVVVIYGDHEGVHKYYPTDIRDLDKVESWWLENDKKVPFIIYDGKLSGEEVKTVGGQIDILPTVAYLMGIEESKYIKTAMGRNLLKTEKSFAVLHNGEYIGDKSNGKQMENAVKGLTIADTIIKGDYFKEEK